MAEMLLVDSLKELRTLIDQQHLLYLQLDENPKKIDQRDKLESYIKEYLCLAPHDTKFTFHQTAEVLHQSANTKSNFSAYKAAVAWKAIGKYADNLISHPWRKEYRDIKLYCGFYKHEIEESLVGAELMFEAMGYKHVGHSCMVLPGILDPDRITSVSKDAIMAFVECQIMKQIWETLSSHYNISWFEILEFRENHTGTPEQVIRALTYKYRQRQYQEQIYHRPQHIRTIDNHIPQTDCIYGQHSLGFYNHTHYPSHSYSLPAQSRYAPTISPQQYAPTIYPNTVHTPYASSPHILKPQDTYPVNGYHHMHPHYATPMGLQHMSHNGYSLVPMMYPVPSIVPTGQLIELDTSPTHNDVDPYLQRPVNISAYNSTQEESVLHQDSLKNDGPSLTGKAKDDGAGSWENWDYVYRNLESQGYKKDFDSPGEIFLKGNQQSSSQNNSSDVDIDSIIQNDFSDKLRKVNIDGVNQGRSESSSTKGRSEIDGEIKTKTLKEKSKGELDKGKDYSKTKVEPKVSKTSPEKTKKEPVRKNSENSTLSIPVSSKRIVSQKKDSELQSVPRESVKPKKLKDDSKSPVVNLDEVEEKWQCVTCTYLNSLSKNVCEMCYKSKERGSELTPQPSGGQECPKCTLVNEPGLTHCAACRTSLKDSPTYI